MTIEELYRWAVKNRIESYTLEISPTPDSWMVRIEDFTIDHSMKQIQF